MYANTHVYRAHADTLMDTYTHTCMHSNTHVHIPLDTHTDTHGYSAYGDTLMHTYT